MHAELSPGRASRSRSPTSPTPTCRQQEAATARRSTRDPGGEGGRRSDRVPARGLDPRLRRGSGTCGCRSRRAASPGSRTSSSPASRRTSALELARGRGGRAPILARRRDARSPRARRRRAARRSAARRSTSPARSASPRPSADELFASRASRRARRSERAASSRPSTPGSRASRAVSFSRSESGERAACSPQPSRTPGQAVKTTIEPGPAASRRLGPRRPFGGVAVLDTPHRRRAGARRTAFSAPQPPGSTFKIVTTAAALEDDAVTLDESFPRRPGADAGGRSSTTPTSSPAAATSAVLRRLLQLGLRPSRGRGRRGDAARDRRATSAGTPSRSSIDAGGDRDLDPPESTIPRPDRAPTSTSPVSAIGQGQVLATPLQMATAAQTSRPTACAADADGDRAGAGAGRRHDRGHDAVRSPRR